MKARVEGQLVFNGTNQMLTAALASGALAYIPADLAQPYIADGQLTSVLKDRCAIFPRCRLYFASRSQSSRALALLLDAQRYRP